MKYIRHAAQADPDSERGFLPISVIDIDTASAVGQGMPSKGFLEIISCLMSPLNGLDNSNNLKSTKCKEQELHVAI